MSNFLDYWEIYIVIVAVIFGVFPDFRSWLITNKYIRGFLLFGLTTILPLYLLFQISILIGTWVYDTADDIIIRIAFLSLIIGMIYGILWTKTLWPIYQRYINTDDNI